MTDYCNSACQRHRPAATANRYAPGHFQTHTNTPKQACVTQVCHQVHMLTNKPAQWVNGRAHTVSHGNAGHVDASRGVYMSAHSLKIAGVTQKTQTETWRWGRSSGRTKTHIHLHKAVGRGVFAHELQPHTEPNSLCITSRAKWLPRPVLSLVYPHGPPSFITCTMYGAGDKVKVGGKWRHMPPEQHQAVLTLNHRGSGTVLHGWTPIFQRISPSNTSVPNPPHVCTFQVNWMTWTKSDNWCCPIPKGSTLGKHRKHKLGCSLRAKCSTWILRYLWGLWDIMRTFGLCMWREGFQI